jgi:hypothetical protein
VARITSVIAASHSPFLFEPVQWWNRTHASRVASGGYAPGLPVDGEAQNAQKHARTVAAYQTLAKVFQRARPDVMLVFGDDQEEQFTSRNHPAFAVYVGGRFEGFKAVAYEQFTPPRKLKPKTPEHWTAVDTHQPLARAVLKGLFDEGFDPAYMTELPNEDFGMGHAFMRPTGRLTEGRFDVPMVPVLVNGLYAPQPSAARCVAAARAIRKAVQAWPEDLSVAVLGSGGMWHTPGSKESYLDEAFDRSILHYLEKGDADGMARYFDAWKPPAEREGLRCFDSFSSRTGVPGGIGSGSGEVRNWIMAAAVADRPGRIVDYVPVYTSPCGMGFAYWDMD